MTCDVVAVLVLSTAWFSMRLNSSIRDPLVVAQQITWLVAMVVDQDQIHVARSAY
jgi:hypothetical protein